MREREREKFIDNQRSGHLGVTVKTRWTLWGHLSDPPNSLFLVSGSNPVVVLQSYPRPCPSSSTTLKGVHSYCLLGLGATGDQSCMHSRTSNDVYPQGRNLILVGTIYFPRKYISRVLLVCDKVLCFPKKKHSFTNYGYPLLLM